MDWQGLLAGGHVAAALLALVAGGVVLWTRKGTATHRGLGRVYAAALLVVNAAALSVHREDAFGVFHWLALVSLATLGFGVVPLLTGRRSRAVLMRHAHFMAWSYVGLVAAGCGQLAAELAGTAPWTVPVVIVGVLVSGGLLIATRVPGALRGVLPG